MTYMTPRIGFSGALRLVLVLSLVGGLVGSVAVIAAQTPRRDPPPLILESLAGRDSFERYCATCHGRSGLGDGPLVSQLKTRPTNLAALARANGGQFPRQRVAAFVEGSSRSASHGSSDMPIWGRAFRALDTSDARVKVRLDNLVAYVESLQTPAQAALPGRPAERPTGAQLFRSYCANCHGDSGRGNGPLVSQLRRTPADLTKFTARNGGVFPAETVRRIVDGRGVASHGDPAMPIWGDVFSRSAGSDAARERIEAIVEFLAAIQERAAE
jgi:mono/diheme cytochrome c family protein